MQGKDLRHCVKMLHRRRLLVFLLVFINATSAVILVSLHQTMKTVTAKEAEGYYGTVLEYTVRTLESFIKDSLTKASTFLLDENVRSYLTFGDPQEPVQPEGYREYSIQKSLKTAKVNDEDIHSIYLFRFSPEAIVTDKGVYASAAEFEEAALYRELRESLPRRGSSRFEMGLRREHGPDGTGTPNIFSLIVPFNTLAQNGALVFNLRETAFTKYFLTARERLTGSTYLVSPEGAVIAPSSAEREGLQELLRFASVFTGHRLFGAAGRTVVFSYTNRYGIRLVHEVPAHELYASVLMFRNILITLWIMIFCASIPFSIWIESSVYRPVERLRNFLKDHNAFRKIEHEDDFELFIKTYQTLFERNSRYRSQLESYRPIMQEIMLYQFMNENPLVAGPAVEMLSEIRNRFTKSHFACIIFRIDGYQQYRAERTDAQIAEDIAFLSEQIDGRLPEAYLVNHMGENEIIILANFTGTETAAETLRGMIRPVRLMFEDYLRRTVTVAVGGPVEGFESLPRAYRTAHIAAAHRLVIGNGAMILYEDLPHGDANGEIPAETLKRLTHAVKTFNRAEADEALKECFSSIRGSMNIYESVTIACSTILKTLAHFTEELGLEIPENGRIGELVTNAETVENLTRWFSTQMNRIIHKLELRKDEKNVDYLTQIEQVIEEQYRNPLLQISTVAEHFNLSATYFGRFFSELTGRNFTNYVNEVRLRHAVELLTSSDATVNQIAEAVGFNSTQYFIRVFKKKYLTTPRGYRLKAETPAA